VQCAAAFSENLSITQNQKLRIVHLKEISLHRAEVPLRLRNCSSDSNFFRSLLSTAETSKCLCLKLKTIFSMFSVNLTFGQDTNEAILLFFSAKIATFEL